MQDPYPEFRRHPFIQTIANTSKWTVSTKDKMPIDMRILATQHKLCGALFNNEQSLMTLDELHTLLPEAANYAFYLDVLTDGFAVLDIEPKCPDEEKEKLIHMPAIYRETSMSGKGIHMVFPISDKLIQDNPITKQKVVFKESHGWYEILLVHYVTFTGNQIPAPADTTDMQSFEQFFTDIASKQTITIRADVSVEEMDAVNTFYSKQILQKLLESAPKYPKTLADFNNDNSKYEFAYIAYFYRILEGLLSVSVIKQEHEYTDSEKAWFLYTTAKEILPHRAKHDEMRSQLPWLLYISREVIAKNQNGQKTKKGANKK